MTLWTHRNLINIQHAQHVKRERRNCKKELTLLRYPFIREYFKCANRFAIALCEETRDLGKDENNAFTCSRPDEHM